MEHGIQKQKNLLTKIDIILKMEIFTRVWWKAQKWMEKEFCIMQKEDLQMETGNSDKRLESIKDFQSTVYMRKINIK